MVAAGTRPANRQPEPRSLGTTAEKYIRGRVAIAWSIIKHQLTSTSTTPAGRWESFGDIRTWTSNKALNVREFGSRGGIPLKTRPPGSRGRLNDLPSLYPSTDGMLKLRAHSRNRGPCKACQASKRKVIEDSHTSLCWKSPLTTPHSAIRQSRSVRAAAKRI